MSIEVKILGTGSASPVFNRHPSSQLLNINNNHFFLFDCGECTQFQMLRYHISHSKISRIFISHLHGDHYLGLVGLLSSMQLWGRKKELFIYGPKGLSEIITVQLQFSETIITYDMHFRELNTEVSELIVDEPTYSIHTIPLSHRIHCCGFIFKEKPKKRRLLVELLPPTLTPLQKIALKKGENIQDEHGNIFRNEEVTLPAKKSLSFAYCSDTAYLESIIPIIHEVDLLFHEATFLSSLQERAVQTFHSTAEQAATIALKAKVGKLIIGHFSSRYKDLQPHLEEAQAIFPNTFIAEEGKSFIIVD
ncbi:MAG TPA: ribonuclease Z [Cytophagaceae bacterium]|nr:ribonuclease Z [Cytophagaceae bacterium]